MIDSLWGKIIGTSKDVRITSGWMVRGGSKRSISITK